MQSEDRGDQEVVTTMPRQNQMIGLMKLAFDQSSYFFSMILHAIIGGTLLTVFFAFFVLANYNQLKPAGTPPVDAWTSAIVTSGYLAFANAVSLLLFIAILIALFAYTVSFLIVCYEYDNRSWELVNFPVYLVDSYVKFCRKNNQAYRESRKKAHKELVEEITKLKNDTDP